jgi:starch synthase
MFRQKDQWRKIQTAGVYQDFGWDRSASRYVQLYNGLTAS